MKKKKKKKKEENRKIKQKRYLAFFLELFCPPCWAFDLLSPLIDPGIINFHLINLTLDVVVVVVTCPAFFGGVCWGQTLLVCEFGAGWWSRWLVAGGFETMYYMCYEALW